MCSSSLTRVQRQPDIEQLANHSGRNVIIVVCIYHIQIRNKLCSSYEVFSFGWTLYVHVKGDKLFIDYVAFKKVFLNVGKYPAIADDLVNSHHLLLCCVDTLYTAVALMGNRTDLLNDTFIGRPAVIF